MWTINPELLKIIMSQKINIEYTSLYSGVNLYSMTTVNGKKYITVPTDTSDSEIVRQWKIGHELGHFLLEKEEGYNPFAISKYEQERKAWEKAKDILEKCKIPLVKDNESFFDVMNICPPM